MRCDLCPSFEMVKSRIGLEEYRLTICQFFRLSRHKYTQSDGSRNVNCTNTCMKLTRNTHIGRQMCSGMDKKRRNARRQTAPTNINIPGANSSYSGNRCRCRASSDNKWQVQTRTRTDTWCVIYYICRGKRCRQCIFGGQLSVRENANTTIWIRASVEFSEYTAAEHTHAPIHPLKSCATTCCKMKN